MQVIERLTRGLSTVEGKIWIYLLQKQWTIPDILRDMSRRGSGPIWKAHQEEVKNYLNDYLPFFRNNFIVVALGRKSMAFELTSANWREWFRQAALGILDVKNKFLRETEVLSEAQLETARREAEEWRTKLASFMQIEKAKLKDIEWWLKHSYYRGLPETKLELPDPIPTQVITRAGQSLLRPVRPVFLTLSDVRVIEHPTYMIVETETGESYQTFFSSVSFPSPIPEDDPTGFEWIYGVLENTPFPVDLALHVRVESPMEAMENLKKKKKTAEAQYREWVENDEDVPLEVEEDMATVSVLEKKLRSRQPLIHVRPVFAIGADSMDELKRRVEEFKQIAGAYHTLVRAPGDMRRMFQAFYPFGEALPTGWETPMDPGVLGAAVPFGTRELGDPSGFWLGRLFNGRPVWMDPRRPAQQLNTTSAIMLVGTLGSGKSYALKYITTLLLSWGARAFLVDPKGETEPLAQLPGIQTRILKFTHDSDTRISPFRIGNVQDARAIMELILNPGGEERRQVLLNQAVEIVFKERVQDMRTFYEAIKTIAETNPDPRDKDEARLIAERVRLMADHEIGRIFFGVDTGEHIFDRQLVTAIVRGLTLPDKSVPKEKWTESERYSAAILYAVATLGLRRLLSLPKSQVKVLAIDEAWVLRRFEQGQRLINEAMRFSRSENLIPILASQNATDFLASANEEDWTGLFAWKIMLHLESRDQVTAALHILGMTDEDPDDWVKRFAEYRNGRGLVRDPEGRIGEIQIEVLPGSLDRYFSSTPG